MSLQGLESHRVQGDRAPAAAALGLAELGCAVDRDPGPANRHRTLLHVEILPGKAEGLSPAHAGGGQQSPEGEETVAAPRQGRRQLLGVPDAQLLLAVSHCLGRVGAGDRVAQPSPAHGVTTGLVQHGVDAAHRGGREATRAVHAAVLQKLSVEGVDRARRELLQLQSAETRQDVLAGEHHIRGVGGGAQAALHRGQPLGCEELLDRGLGGWREALSLQGGEDLGEGSLTLMRVAKPPLIARRRSSVSASSPPQLGQASLGLRSTQKRRPQTWQRWASAMPTSTMYS